MRGWSKEQKAVVIAAWLGWTLDGFDFTLVVFVLRDIARSFASDISAVSFTLVLSLALRPIGAFLFGRAADLYGRRPALMASILAYSLLTFASAFATSLGILLILRALFGIAMGGEWGVGASLTMETIPAKTRGLVSGILQTGYPAGYVLASAVYGLLFSSIGWRGMFMLGVLPALLALYIRSHTKESPEWRPRQVQESARSLIPYGRLSLYAVMLWAGVAVYQTQPMMALACIGLPVAMALLFVWRDRGLWLELLVIPVLLLVDGLAHLGTVPPLMAAIYNLAAILTGVFLKAHLRLGIYGVLLLTALNVLTHGAQDLYPTFLQLQHGFSPGLVGVLVALGNIGAMAGSFSFGTLSERIGRRRAIMLAALLALPAVPFFAFGGSLALLAAGNFLLLFMAQGTWGVVPAYLNELSPPAVRGTFPGFVYQLGNLLASVTAALQAGYAMRYGGNYAVALAAVVAAAALATILLVWSGPERKGIHLGTGEGDAV